MPSLVRNSTGLLLQEDFSAAHGWASGTGFSLVADPALVAFPLQYQWLLPDPKLSLDYAGVREPQLYIEPAAWYLLYDAGDDVNGWQSYIARSVDRGITWTKLGQISIGLADGSGGFYAAVAIGWFEKRGSTYYLHRITAGTAFVPPNVGLPASPYEGDTWSASDPLGTWTFVRAWGPGTGWASGNLMPGSVYFDGTTYTMAVEGADGSDVWKCGLQTATAPDGPWTLNATAQFTNASFAGTRMPENPKIFYHAGLSSFICLMNLIDPTGNFTDRNAAALSSSVGDWSAATKYITQRNIAPCDSVGNIVGVATHATGSDGALIGELGYVPFTYDSDPRESTPGWHLGRAIRGGVLEPAAHRLHYSDATTTRHSYSQSLAHTDFVAELEVDFAALATGADVSFEYRSNGTTGYRLTVRADAAAPRLLLQTLAATSIQSNTTGAAIVEALVMHRIRVACVGSQHDAWIDGEHQISVSDATYASGTQVAISAVKVTADIRLLHVRTSDTITIRGLPKGKTINIRSFGQLPISQVQSDRNGVATYSGTHFPVSRIEVAPFDTVPAQAPKMRELFDGDAQTNDLLLWGGDDVTYQPGARNLLVSTSALGTVQWWPVHGATIAQDGTAGPFGDANEAWLLKEDSSNNPHFLVQDAPILFVTSGYNATPLSPSTTYTFSVYAKQGSGTRALMLQFSDLAGSGKCVFFDVSAGTALGASGAVGAIGTLGSGWFRCSILFDSGIGGSPTAVQAVLATAAQSTPYTGDGASGIYLARPQLQLGSLSAYSP